jgi:hypothetical protein
MLKFLFDISYNTRFNPATSGEAGRQPLALDIAVASNEI